MPNWKALTKKLTMPKMSKSHDRPDAHIYIVDIQSMQDHDPSEYLPKIF